MPQAAIAQTFSTPAVSRKAAKQPARPVLAIETSRLILRAEWTHEPNVLRVAVLLKPGLMEAGWLRFDLRNEIDRDVELGFFLEAPHRGRGLMHEAARAALPQVLRLFKARTLGATVPSSAPAAESVARRLGLVAMSRRGAGRRFEKDLCGLI